MDGYKDVQFGWLVVNENKSSSSKQALFLVMFIPTREVLEVWSMQNYEKISMSKVSKTGRYVVMQTSWVIDSICITSIHVLDFFTQISVCLEL